MILWVDTYFHLSNKLILLSFILNLVLSFVASVSDTGISEKFYERQVSDELCCLFHCVTKALGQVDLAYMDFIKVCNRINLDLLLVKLELKIC